MKELAKGPAVKFCWETVMIPNNSNNYNKCLGFKRPLYLLHSENDVETVIVRTTM